MACGAGSADPPRLRMDGAGRSPCGDGAAIKAGEREEGRVKVFAGVEQGSAQWHQMRAGRATASMFHRIITPGGKLSAQSEDYIDYLIGSGFVKEHEEWAGNKWTDRGTEL